MRLLIDENIPVEIAEKLRLLGHDVKSIRECCRGVEDEKVIEIAIKEKRVIITYDLDFGELYRNLGAGAVVLRLRTRQPAIVLNHLVDSLAAIERQKIDIQSKLAILKEGKLRLIG